ncbi:hypothetical protein BCR33DRAFT_532326 [Rhizoclosmatium globosum]|uniref:Uncharacterized protein n=1 Tax=Rhizoclosmatium globosum TaxID=329046 RepID=A0A1Y2CUE2_9FUNG|nr:hypothetical protein BCR33DRAFT_532326 [Rhizoclosmatium globosum]|eukprot:ORY50577.1 hypothetical protein BCR33DRAFT_532326 [Rhizoclosmatium globosum]
MCKAVRGFGVVERDLEEVWMGVVGLPNCVKDYCLNEKGFGKGVNEFYYGLQTKELVGVVCSGYSFGALESCAAATCTAKDVDAVKAFEPGFKKSCDSVKSWSGLAVTTVATAMPTSTLTVSTQLNTAASTGTTKAAVTTNLSSAAMTTAIGLIVAATFIIFS